MQAFVYHDGELYAEGVPLSAIAERFGTPCFVYSRNLIEAQYRAFDDALAPVRHLVCYAVKANSSLAVLNLLARQGAGFDIVSGGELRRVLRAGGAPERIVFSGVAKSTREIEEALDANILCFNVESAAELERLQTLAARKSLTARVSLRVNPDVDARTHPYISTGLKQNKFGIDLEEAMALFQRAATMPHLEIVGIACHIGSQLTDLGPFVDALDRVLDLADRLQAYGISLDHIDIGGGLGVVYQDETPPSPREYAAALLSRLSSRHLKLYVEPGRAIVARAGVLLTRIEYLKTNGIRHFALVDAAMNDLIRPALYGAWMPVDPVMMRGDVVPAVYDIAGPICETADFLARDRSLAILAGDLLAIGGAGAYSFVMSSNYNSRCRVAEVMVDGQRCELIRERESFEDLIRGERILPDRP